MGVNHLASRSHLPLPAIWVYSKRQSAIYQLLINTWIQLGRTLDSEKKFSVFWAHSEYILSASDYFNFVLKFCKNMNLA